MSLSSIKNIDLLANANSNSQQPQQYNNTPPPRQQQAAQSPTPGQQFNQNKADPSEPPAPESPLEKWKKVFDNTPNPQNQSGGEDPSQNQKSAEPQKSDQLKLPSAQELNASMQNYDFTQGLDREEVGKALSGDQDSFLKIMSQVARNAAVTSSAVSMHGMNPFLEQTVNSARTQAVQDANNNVKFDTARSLLGQANPELMNPAIAPTVQNLMQQYSQAYPQATASELSQAVGEYVKSMFGGQQQSAQETDPTNNGWSDLIPG